MGIHPRGSQSHFRQVHVAVESSSSTATWIGLAPLNGTSGSIEYSGCVLDRMHFFHKGKKVTLSCHFKWQSHGDTEIKVVHLRNDYFFFSPCFVS